MTSFFENGSGQPGGLTATSNTVVAESSFFENLQGTGTPVPPTIPFQGVLAEGHNHIGQVGIDGTVQVGGTVHVDSLPPVSGSVGVTNWPTTQQVNVINLPGTQDVRITNQPAVQPVSGTLSIDNWPTSQNVTLTGQSQVLASLTSGSNHIGSVSLDGAIQGSVSIQNFPSVQATSVTNFPLVQNILGSVTIQNTDPIPVYIKASDVQMGGGGGGTGVGTSFDGIIRNSALQPIPVTVQGGSTFDGVLKAGSAHVGSVSLDAPVSLTAGTTVGIQGLVGIQGSVSVSNFPGSFAISNFPTTQPVSGTVTVANPVTSVAVSNLPATQAISGTVTVANPVSTVSVSNLPADQQIHGTVAVSNFPAAPTNQNVTVTNAGPIPVTVEGGSTFDGVLKAGTAAIGTVKVDSTVPVRVEVTNPSTGGGGTTTVAPESLTVLAARGLFPEHSAALDVRAKTHFSVVISCDTDTSLEQFNGDVILNQFNGALIYLLEGSQDQVTWTQITTAAMDFSSGPIGQMSFGPFEIATMYPSYDYVRVTIDRTSIYANDPANTSLIDSIPFKGTITGHAYVAERVQLEGYNTLNVTGQVTSTPQANGRAVSDDYPFPVKVVSNLATAVSIAGTPTVKISGVNTTNGALNVLPAGIIQTALTLDNAAVSAVNRLPVDVAFPATQAVSGTVSAAITSMPAVSLASNAMTVSGTVSLANPYDGVLKLAGAAVSASNRLPVDVAFPATQAVSGSVSVSNLPATQAISGTVAVSNAFDGALKLAGSAVSASNPLPVAAGAVGAWIESTATLSANQTVTGAARANQGGGLAFVAKAMNNSFFSNTVLRIEGSSDGTTWASVKTVSTGANMLATLYVEANLPYYRGVFVNGGGAASGSVNFQTYYTATPIDYVSTVNVANTPTVYQGGAPGWNESTAGLAAGATFTGTSRSTGIVSSQTYPYTTFAATVYSDQQCVVRIEVQEASAAWFKASNEVVVPAGCFWTVSAPVVGYNYRVVVVNGSTASSALNIRSVFSRSGAVV